LFFVLVTGRMIRRVMTPAWSPEIAPPFVERSLHPGSAGCRSSSGCLQSAVGPALAEDLRPKEKGDDGVAMGLDDGGVDRFDADEACTFRGEGEQRRACPDEDVVDVDGRKLREHARTDEAIDVADRHFEERTHVVLDEPIHPLPVDGAFVDHDPMELGVFGRESNELPDDQFQYRFASTPRKPWIRARRSSPKSSKRDPTAARQSRSLLVKW
jgi:hypothetical protein